MKMINNQLIFSVAGNTSGKSFAFFVAKKASSYKIDAFYKHIKIRNDVHV